MGYYSEIDDIDLTGGSHAELQDLTSKLVDSAGAFGMEGSSEKSKIMINSRKDIAANITMNEEPLEQVDNFKYLGASLSKDGTCTAEVRIRIARATASMTSPRKIWRSNISFKTKFKLYYSLVLSNLLYGCETWTLMTDTEKRVQEFVITRVQSFVGPRDPLLATAKRRKLQ